MTATTEGDAPAESPPKDGPGWAVLELSHRALMVDMALEIAEGELAEGTPMPSVKQLQDTYDIPASAARHILRQLADRQLIRRVPGRGYVVGVPGVTPVPPSPAELRVLTWYVAGPRGCHPIPSAEALLAQRQAGIGPATGRTGVAADAGPRALTGPDAIDRYCDQWIFEQVADIMAARITAGQFPPGERFASAAALRREFAISDASARRALRELTDRGLIHTVPGRACFTGPESAGHPRPHYQRIAADLAGQIFSGQIPIHRPIPVRVDLKERYGVCDHTVERAVGLLNRLGWVECVPYRRPVAAPPTRWPVSLDGSPS